MDGLLLGLGPGLKGGSDFLSVFEDPWSDDGLVSAVNNSLEVFSSLLETSGVN